MKIRLALAAASFALAAPAMAQTVTVSGDDNPYLAGQPVGTTCCDGGIEGVDTVAGQGPTQAPSGVVGGQSYTITGTGGFINYPATPFGTLDGGPYSINMPAGVSTFAISGALNVPISSLVGVFLGATEPDGSAPAQLDFSSLTLNFTSLTPGLGQIFFIGDGLTGTGSGAAQQFIAPAGATRLFLGSADIYGWANNVGSGQVTISAAPEPGTWVMMIAGFGIAGVALRRRRAPAKRAIA